MGKCSHFGIIIAISHFAQPSLKCGHSIGPVVGFGKILYITTNGPHNDSKEKFYGYRETKKCNQLNDKRTVGPSAVFDVMTQHNTQLNLN